MRILKLACLLTSEKLLPSSLTKVEDLMSDKPSVDEERASEVGLKPLSSSLRYEFLGPNSHIL